MNQKFNFNHKASAQIIRKASEGSNFSVGGHFVVQCFSKDGTLKWESLAKNGVTNVGLNNILDVYFNATDSVGGVTTAGWAFALGVISSSGYSALAATDTHASHAGWTEFTGYTVGGAAKRSVWTVDPAASQTIANPTPVELTVTSGGTIKGLFIVGGNVSGTGAAGAADEQGGSNANPVLWSTALFVGGDRVVASTDLINAYYTISAASA